MWYKLIFWGLLLLGPLSFLRAQLPDQYESSTYYLEGMEWFRKGIYPSAAVKFRNYIEGGETGGKLTTQLPYLAEAQFYLALCEYLSGRKTAKEDFELFISKYAVHPQMAEARLWLARQYFREKAYRRVIQELAPLSRPDPQISDTANQEIAYMSGICWYHFKEYNKSLEELNTLIQKPGPWQIIATRFVGLLYYERKNYTETVRILSKLSPSDHTAETLLGCTRAYAQLKDISGLNDFIAQFPTETVDAEIYLIQAAACVENEKYPAAMESFDKFLSHKNIMPPALRYAYAFTAFKLEKYTLALPIFEKIGGGEDSLAAPSAYYLAFCYLQQNNIESARMAFFKASRLGAKTDIGEESSLQYAKLSFQSQQFEDALQQSQNYLAQYPSGKYENEIRSMMGEVWFQTGNYKESITLFEKNNLKDERSLKAYQRSCWYYGLELYRKQIWQEADLYFRKGFNLQQDPIVAAGCRYWYAESLFRQGKWDASLQQYQKFLELPLNPKPAYYIDAWYGMGWAALRLDKIENASEAFRQYLTLSKESENSIQYQDALLRAGDCEMALKNYAEAMQWYYKSTQTQNPYLDYSWYKIGLLNYRLEKYSEAINTWKKVIQQYPKSKYREAALDQSGDTYLKWMTDYAQASQASRTLIAEYPNSPYIPEAFNRMGIAAFNSSDKAAAEKYFRKVVTEYCSDTLASKVALNNLPFVVNTEVYAEILEAYRKSCPDINSDVENIAWEAASTPWEGGEWASALPLLNLYIRDYSTGPHVFEARYARAVCLSKTGKPQEALQDLTELINSKLIHPYVLPACLLSGELNTLLGKHETAAIQYEKALSIAVQPSERWNIMNLQIEAWVTANKYPEALKSIEQLLSQPGGSIAKRQDLEWQGGKILLLTKDTISALQKFKDLEKAATGTVAGARAQYEITRILIQTGQDTLGEEAGLYLKSNYSAYREWVIRGYMELAELYIRQQDTIQAQDILDYILSQPQDYYSGMKEAAKQIQDRIRVALPPPKIIPEENKKERKK